MQVGFLGLGAMGARMAARLLQAGHMVTLWNRSYDKAAALLQRGAQWAPTPAAAVTDAEVAISMLRDDEASLEVWLGANHGALAALPKSAIALDCSTLSMAAVRRLAEAACRLNVAFLDAPVAGSRPQAEAGQLIFFVGGNPGAAERAMPLLTAMGSAIHSVGPNGCGAAVKLAVNALFGVQVAAMAEVLGLLATQGVDLGRAVEAIGATPVASPALKMAAGSMLAGAFAPLFPVELAAKDFGYVTAAGSDGGMPLAAATLGVLRRAEEAGLGGQNLTAVARLYRQTD